MIQNDLANVVEGFFSCGKIRQGSKNGNKRGSTNVKMNGWSMSGNDRVYNYNKITKNK